VKGLLDSLNGPEDLRRLDAEQLPALAAEIRERLVQVVTETGGHLGPNLGVVELTMALHRVFDSPRDLVVWDTGHQSYVHKMLTGRAAQLPTLRRAGGLSGYPRREESRHDLVENSHASTALSYADGLANGLRVLGAGDRHVVAVVGDGALTGGMCWEALNNLAEHRGPVVIALNDNGRSYAPTVGAVAAHLAALRRGDAEGNLFTDLGLEYVGPVDGHDVAALEEAFGKARALGRPVVVHCVTRKGCGYAPAEQHEADRMHTISPLPQGKPVAPRVSPHQRPWTDVFAEELVAIGHERPDVVSLTAAMAGPTGIARFAEAFPDRAFDVGIAEQHAVASAAGLATAGLHPVVAIYATFLNRAFDQVLMDVALHRLPVTFVLDRAGVTGPDGPSHHGMWDVSLMSLVPGTRVAAPRDAVRLRELLRESVAWAEGPTVVRFPKGTAPVPHEAVGRWGTADVLTQPSRPGDVLLVAVGPMATAALDAAAELAADGIAATVVDPRWAAPIEPALVLAASHHRLVVTVEDAAVSGGFGDAFARALRCAGLSTELLTLGLDQGFVPVGERADLLRQHGLDAAGIAGAVRSLHRPLHASTVEIG
jgi:1-deoxy-D-xylulose-5-phosphate synthase